MQDTATPPTAPIRHRSAITRQYDRAACHAYLTDPVDSNTHTGTMQKIAATIARMPRSFK